VVKEVSPERLRRFFVHETGTYRVVKELRDMCIFSSHSVIRDPPFSRLDLISCRNLLIYLKPSLQAQIIPLFHYSLRPSGYLFLGSSENVSRHSELFTSLDRKSRIFRRRDLVARPPLPLQQFLTHSQRERAAPEPGQSGLLQRADILRRVANTIAEHFVPTYVIVDDTGQTLYFSSGAGKYLQPAVGPPSRDIVAMARPGLRTDLRTALHRARETGQRVVRDGIHVQLDGGVQLINLAVEPVVEGKEIAYGIVFTDRESPRGQDETSNAGDPKSQDATVQLIEKELQETKERLQSAIEELETANEEFRSSNEELLSVNEELQSTNEELETSKEELQSVNEELQTVNNELSTKIDELDRANSDLNNLFQSTQIATIFLDLNLEIRSFTPAVTKLFNLIPGDCGRPLTDIVSRVDYPDLERDMRRVCASGEIAERAVGGSGGTEHYLARILPYRGPNNVIDGILLTFVDVTNLVAAEEQQKVLAAELSHRVKNTLAVVSSIAERTLSEDDAKENLIGRLHALGHTHDVLSECGWTEAGLRELISAELSPHGAGDGDILRISGPPVMLRPQAALFLTLALHELSTNAAKYGALSVPGGRVAVSWIITGDRPPRLEINWQEEGGPKVDGFGAAGFGTELIERGIRFELQGEAKLETVNGGLHCRIVIPANPQNLTFESSGSRRRTEDPP
jgi:two-component system CheB/CheR fusion protein